jgi:hypothetical protein
LIEMLVLKVGVVLAVISGICSILTSSILALTPLFAGFLFEYVGWMLAEMISVSSIIGAVLVYKNRVIVGSYLMVSTSLMWIASILLQFFLPTPATGTLMGIIGGALFILAIVVSPWPILSLIGGILILSTSKKPLRDIGVVKA